MRIKTDFWKVEAELSVSLRKNIELAYWTNEENKYEQGLAISLPQQSLNNFLRHNKPTYLSLRYDTVHADMYLGFDEGITFLKKLKNSYKNQKEHRFHKDYANFLEEYIRRIHHFSLTSKLKPSLVAEEFLGRPIDLLNADKFYGLLYKLPNSLKKALTQERGLLHYPYAYGCDRFHILKFSLEGVREKLNEQEVLHFDKHYAKFLKNGVTGDALKAEILARIQLELSASEEVQAQYLAIKQRYDYKLLAQSQGITTRLFGIFGVKTSSVEALDKWMNFTYPKLMQSLTPSKT